MGRTFVSTLFSSGEEFEAWVQTVKNKTTDWDKKAVKIDVTGKRLRLLDKDDTVLASVEYYYPDGTTIKASSGGLSSLTVYGVKETNKGNTISLWVGTKAEYDKITSKSATTWYCITDDPTLDELRNRLLAVENRTTALEERATLVENRVKAIENSQPASVTVVEELRDDLSETKTKLATLTGTVNTQGDDIEELRDDLSETNTKIETYKQNLSNEISSAANTATTALDEAETAKFGVQSIIDGDTKVGSAAAADWAATVNGLKINKTEAWTFTYEDESGVEHTITKNVVIL